MSAAARLPTSALLLALLLGLGTAARATPLDATDAAFAALLDMPGAQPREGGWIIPPQDWATPDTEQALIARLRTLKQAGADFNATRHRGTLLAHAIRAGKERTALWLLNHGADPVKVLRDRPGTAYTLATEYRRLAVLKALEARPEFKASRPTPTPTSPAARPSPAAAPVPASSAPAGRTERLRAQMLALAGPYGKPTAQAQGAWRDLSRQFSDADFAAIFQDGAHLDALTALSLGSSGDLEAALSRLPVAWVRAKGQVIAEVLMQHSTASLDEAGSRRYSVASLSWPALWRRLDRPLRYDGRDGLAGLIPPVHWPALFASGYARHEPEMSGCTLSAVDLKTFQALWPDYLRHFSEAREQAPAMVLAPYLVASDALACRERRPVEDTVAKLRFLRQQGIRAGVSGLQEQALRATDHPELEALLAHFTAEPPREPRLVPAPPACRLELGEPWLDRMARTRSIGWGIPPEAVQAIDVPGHAACGLVLLGDSFDDSLKISVTDSFEGPQRDAGIPRCADSPNDGELWTLQQGVPQPFSWGWETRGLGFPLSQVLDRETGRRYLLTTGEGSFACIGLTKLPDVLDWNLAPRPPQLRQAPDRPRVERLLRERCEQPSADASVVCQGLGRGDADAGTTPPLTLLKRGGTVPFRALMDALGAPRRAAYRQALAQRRRSALQQLTAAGIPPHWTAEEIRSLQDQDLPKEEKRRRLALLFADAGQLERAFAGQRSALLSSLLAWLPDEDWGPVLRLIAAAPHDWRSDIAAVRGEADARPRLACRIDHAQDYLCGGGIVLD